MDELFKRLQNNFGSVPLELEILQSTLRVNHIAPPLEWILHHEVWSVQDALLLLSGISPAGADIEVNVYGELQIGEANLLVGAFSGVPQYYNPNLLYTERKILEEKLTEEDIELARSCYKNPNTDNFKPDHFYYIRTLQAIFYITRAQERLNKLWAFWLGKAGAKSNIKKEFERKTQLKPT